MSYEPDDMVMIGKHSISRADVHRRIASLGWTMDQVLAMEEADVAQVFTQKTRAPGGGVVQPPPIQRPQAAAPVAPGGKIDINAIGEDPEIMGDPATAAAAAARAADTIGPPSLVTPAGSMPPSPHHRRPIDPTRPQLQPAAGSAQPQLAQPPAAPVAKPAPRQDPGRLKTVLQAASALAKNQATHDLARSMLKEHGLQIAFTTLYPKEADILFDEVDYVAPAGIAPGAVILAIETHPNVIYLITNLGTLAISGQGVSLEKHKEAP
jgi:hypothetical protein